MKIFLKHLLLALFLGASSGILSGQSAPLDLYLKPDIKSPSIGRTTLSDPRLGQATPVMDDAKAALGWHFADYSGMVDAYVQDAKIGKDMLPVDDALIYAGPSEDSPVIGTYRTGSPIEIVDTGVWWKLRFGGGIPVYFVLDTPPPLPAVTGFAEDAPAPAEGPVIVSSTVVDNGSTAATSSIVLSESKENPRPGVVGQSYQGTFRQSKRALGLFKPKAPFYLEAADGNRIAWVDTTEIVIPGSMKAFLDQQVIIHGERTQAESSRDWIIHARNMRLK